MLAYCYQRQGLLDQAITYCKRSLEKNANNPSAWIIMGTTFLMKNDTENALIAFENAKKYAPDQIDGYHGIALTYYTQKKYSESLTVINEFEKLRSKNSSIRDRKKMKKLKSIMVTNE
jgi:cytochrome c-type biogenesis protein CcmH/NrfG